MTSIETWLDELTGPQAYGVCCVVCNVPLAGRLKSRVGVSAQTGKEVYRCAKRGGCAVRAAA